MNRCRFQCLKNGLLLSQFFPPFLSIVTAFWAEDCCHLFWGGVGGVLPAAPLGRPLLGLGDSWCIYFIYIPWSILLQNDVNNMFRTQVEPIGIRCIFFSHDMTCVLYLGSCVWVCVWAGGGGVIPIQKNSPQLGDRYFLEKKRNIWFQNWFFFFRHLQ